MAVPVRFLATLALATFSLLSPPVATAQENYPNRSIRVLVGYAPGGGSDIIARLISQRLQLRLGQPVVVENRPGAGGNLAVEQVAKARPDGYTILVTPNTVTMAPALFSKLSFDVVKDLSGVGVIATSPMVLIVNPQVPIASIADLVRYAKANPGKLSYSTPGIGTPQHLGTELFKAMTGTDIVHIPYKGGAPAVAAVAANEVPLSFAAVNSAMPMIDGNRVRAIATSEAKAFPQLGLPTIGATVPGYDVGIWYGVMVPAGTPRPIVERLNSELAAIVQIPEVKESMTKQGYVAAVAPPAHMDAQVRAEVDKWLAAAKQAGIKQE
jgi:tripartite-type tricarboxylate transporter receptor subunit TctC